MHTFKVNNEIKHFGSYIILISNNELKKQIIIFKRMNY